jgi:hypothetical protein
MKSTKTKEHHMMKKKAMIFEEKTIYAPRVGATVRRRPNSVTFTFPGGVKAAAALLEAAALVEAGQSVNIRVMDGGTTVGRVVVALPKPVAA